MQNRTGAKMKRGQQAWGQGKGRQARHGKANKAVVAKTASRLSGRHRPRNKNSQQMIRPAQALQQKQPADDPTGTGLAANSQQTKWPAQAL